jgi:lipopolysaccharide export system permease protein
MMIKNKASMTLFDRYIFKNVLLGGMIITIVLTLLVMLVQSIRFLELIMNSGASMAAFGVLMALSVPRFVEIILPIALLISTLFMYNKLSVDSELVIMRAAGRAPLNLAKPTLILCALLMPLLFLLSAWVAPVSLAKIQTLRQEIRAEYSTLLFREGVFNSVGSGLTAYIREKRANGEMRGIMIHDSRGKGQNQPPTTIVAKRGVSLITDEGQKIIVYNGTRHAMNPQTNALSRLDFEQYTIDIPESAGTRHNRWKEPDERTLIELIDKNRITEIDLKSHGQQLISEAHRRISLPFMMLAFATMGLSCLLTGAMNRRGLNRRVILASIGTIVVQGLYLMTFNFAQKTAIASVFLYLIPLSVIVFCLFMLSASSEKLKYLINTKSKKPSVK